MGANKIIIIIKPTFGILFRRIFDEGCLLDFAID